MHDVYAYGVIAPSTLIELSDDYPPPAGYAEIAATYSSIGGEAAASAYVLARLGVATKLAGSRLGRDESSSRVVEALTSAGVDTTAISHTDPVPAAMEVIVSAGESRTIFGTYKQLIATGNWDAPSEADVRASRMVCLDPFFAEQSLHVARWCSDAGVPYVTVDTSPESVIARGAEVLVVSEEFAAHTIGDDSLEVFAAYTQHCRGLVILTRGNRSLLYGRAGENPREHAPFSVAVRDTTGAGDSFRAGIIYGLLREVGDQELVETAGAVAAMVCQTVPGVLGSPTEKELGDFLSSNR